MMQKGTQVGNYSIIVAECLAIQEPLTSVIKKTVIRIIIESDSQLIVNAINGKIFVPRDIVNLVEDISNIFPVLRKLVLFTMLENAIVWQIEWQRVLIYWTCYFCWCIEYFFSVSKKRVFKFFFV